MIKVPQKTTTELPSLDYVAGFVSCQGNFGWIKKNKNKVPFFQIKTHSSNMPILKLIGVKLGLQEKIHKYEHHGRRYALLVVWKKATLGQVIIPAFEFRLFDKKQKQFERWKKRFYRLWLYKLYPKTPNS